MRVIGRYGKYRPALYGSFNVKHNGQTAGFQSDLARWKAGRDLVSVDLGLLSADYTKNMTRAMAQEVLAQLSKEN